MNAALGLLIILPLIGFLINFLVGRKLPKTLSGIIGSAAVFGSFLISVSFFISVLNGNSLPADQTHTFFHWFSLGKFSVEFSFLVDRLSVMMLLIITGVGFLIHVYSIGYMHDDKGFSRFFAYLNLFIFFMQILVLGASYLITFIGWEGVGLCSYLLIGFWYKNQEYNNAAKKAFIMNRIGDLGFLIGIFWILDVFGTVNYTEVFSAAKGMEAGDTTLIIITLLLFVGAIGKSAQIPLYTWLPDAMAGPTPVSALIHAATMVTAGIFLIVRSHILFALAPATLEVIAIVGLVTSVFAATIGLAQNDIKKVLAYSTISQLGFMFIALGVGAFGTAMFHLMTHAFFKALLFLGAGSVIHAMDGEQDIRKMGGLRKKLPLTYVTFLIGTIAISGIPPFAGFFSKDEILAHAFEYSPVLWVFGVISSVLTAVYMFRLLYLTFFGEFRGTEHQREHLHESPSTMTFPLIVLAVLAAIGGFVGMPELFGAPHKLGEYLSPILADLPANLNEKHALSHGLELSLMATSAILAVIVMIIAGRKYSRKTAEGMEDEQQGAATRVLAHKYYVDELYDTIIVKPLFYLSKVFDRFVDRRFIDGIVNGAGRLVNWGGQYIRLVQTGNIGFYIFAMVISIIILLLVNRLLIV
jgi:NADH-quinone oxidoreductase subunit L